MGYRLGGLLGKSFGIDTDRKHPGSRGAVARRHDTVLDIEPELASQISEEIAAIVTGLESDQIVGEHRLDQFAMMRHPGDGTWRGPWRVQEEAERPGDAEFAQFGAQRKEMIILNP